MLSASEQLENIAQDFARDVEAKVQCDIDTREKRYDYAAIARHYFALARRVHLNPV